MKLDDRELNLDQQETAIQKMRSELEFKIQEYEVRKHELENQMGKVQFGKKDLVKKTMLIEQEVIGKSERLIQAEKIMGDMNKNTNNDRKLLAEKEQEVSGLKSEIDEMKLGLLNEKEALC